MGRIKVKGVKPGFRDKKIPLIKVLRMVTNMGLKDAKEMTEALLGGYKNDKDPFIFDPAESAPPLRLEPWDNVLDFLVGNGFDAELENPIVFDSKDAIEHDDNKCADCGARINVDTLIEVAEQSGAIPDWFITLLKKWKYGVM